MTLPLIIIVVAVIAALAWNFIPAVREKMRGLSTVIETIGALSLTASGVIGEAIFDLKAQGMIPANIEIYVPWIIAAYFIAKRFQTKTAIGQK